MTLELSPEKERRRNDGSHMTMVEEHSKQREQRHKGQWENKLVCSRFSEQKEGGREWQVRR